MYQPKWTVFLDCHRKFSIVLFLLISVNLIHAKSHFLQEELTVKGTVLDENGVPLLGVNVLEKNTSNGVSTDFDGNFSINIADESAVLVFSYLGFEEKEILVANVMGSLSELEVNLTPSSSQLSEVVVVGYGQETKATPNICSN